MLLPAEVLFLWGAVALYAASTMFYVVSLVFQQPQRLGVASRLAAAGLVSQSLSLLLRWIEAGHGPYLTFYESLNSHSWAAVLFFLVFQRWNPRYRFLGVGVMPVAFLLIGLGALSGRDIVPVPANFAIFWLVVHVLFAMSALSSSLVATAFSFLYLARLRLEKGGASAESDLLARLPSLQVLEDLSYRFVALGFILQTIMMAAGAIWAERAWGRYWGWDPVETWTLISWLVYGIYLHLRITYRWRGTRAVWFTTLGLGVLLFSFFGVVLFYRGLHSSVWLIR